MVVTKILQTSKLIRICLGVPTLAQLVERRTVVGERSSLGRWFESGKSDPYNTRIRMVNTTILSYGGNVSKEKTSTKLCKNLKSRY